MVPPLPTRSRPHVSPAWATRRHEEDAPSRTSAPARRPPYGCLPSPAPRICANIRTVRKAVSGNGRKRMVAFTVNGVRRELGVDANTPLLWVLREHLKLTGTKFGCGIASCGACTVHIDGQAA